MRGKLFVFLWLPENMKYYVDTIYSCLGNIEHLVAHLIIILKNLCRLVCGEEIMKNIIISSIPQSPHLHMR